MTAITFVLADGSRRVLDGGDEMTVMHVAVRHDVPGIVAECGGVNACATCHVYVAPEWAARVGPPNEDEADMLEQVAAERRPESRLSCQIAMCDALDGLIVTVPERQS